MTIIQRFRHLRVLAPETVVGTGRYRPADRAALVKKAMIAAYGNGVNTDPEGYLATLHADLVATLQHLETDSAAIVRRSNQLRSDFASYALSQPEDAVVGE